MRKVLHIVVIAGMLLISIRSHAQTLNYKMASMFIYNFTKYIEWPPGNNPKDFVIGVYGTSPFTSELTGSISGKHVGAKTILVTTIKNMDEAVGCQILFIPASQLSNLKKISDMLKGKPVLIVCETEGMSKKGAGICLFLDEDDDYKTKFELNKTGIVASGLTIAQSLLLLAAHVY